MKNPFKSAYLSAVLALFSIIFLASCGGDDPEPEGTVSLTTNDAEEITASSAMIEVELSTEGNVQIDEKGICWSTDRTPTINDDKTDEGSRDSDFSSEMTDLDPNTLYYVRAYVTTESGETTYGNQVSFTTLSSLNVSVTTVTPTSISQNSATSGGSITVSGTGTINAKGVCWSTSQNPTISGSKTSDGTGTASFTSQLTNLVANTTYYVRAYATDHAGATTYGNQLSFTTPTYSVTVTTNEVNASTLQTGGSIATTGTVTITSRGVCWNTSANPTIANSKTTNGTGTGSFTASLTSVTTGTQYFVRAYATDNFGVTHYGDERTVTPTGVTLDGLWKNVTGVSILRINGNVSSWETFTPNTVYQAAINNGLFNSATDPHLKNIVKTGPLTYTADIHSIAFTESSWTGVITIDKVGYINGTITLTANGASFSTSLVVPSGQGWPSNLVGRNYTSTFNRQ